MYLNHLNSYDKELCPQSNKSFNSDPTDIGY